MDRIKREGNRIKDTVLGKPEAPKPGPAPQPPPEGATPGEQMPS
jgi:hypothetical protein